MFNSTSYLIGVTYISHWSTHWSTHWIAHNIPDAPTKRYFFTNSKTCLYALNLSLDMETSQILATSWRDSWKQVSFDLLSNSSFLYKEAKSNLENLPVCKMPHVLWFFSRVPFNLLLVISPIKIWVKSVSTCTLGLLKVQQNQLITDTVVVCESLKIRVETLAHFDTHKLV